MGVFTISICDIGKVTFLLGAQSERNGAFDYVLNLKLYVAILIFLIFLVGFFGWGSQRGAGSAQSSMRCGKPQSGCYLGNAVSLSNVFIFDPEGDGVS